MTQEIVQMSHVRKAFSGNEVLKDISFSVKEGEVLSIIGPSGSGKSTLLRCATMLETMDSGTLTFLGKTAAATGKDGRCVYADAKELREIHSYFGLVFQNFNLFPHYSVLKNVIDPLIHVQKMGKQQAAEIGRKFLAKMGLSDKENAYPCELSGGQKQRVSIARALALNPKVLFFDEPTSALDPELTGEILRVIKELAREHMTMVIVTHEMSFARDVANHVIFMDGGMIVEEGSPEQVINQPRHERTQAFLKRFSEN